MRKGAQRMLGKQRKKERIERWKEKNGRERRERNNNQVNYC